MDKIKEDKIKELIKLTSFEKKASVAKFYHEFMDLIKDEDLDNVLHGITLYHSGREGNVDLFNFLLIENNCKKNLYLCKILSMSKNYTLSGIDFYHGVFLPFIKEGVSKKGISKSDKPFYNDFLSLSNIDLLFTDKEVFKGLGNLNKLLKSLAKITDFSVLEKNLENKEKIPYFFSKLIVSKTKTLIREDYPYYSKNLFNILRTYPHLADTETKSGYKKIKFIEKMAVESPYMTYEFFKANDIKKSNELLNFYVNDIAERLSKNREYYNISSLNSFKQNNILDFRLIEEFKNWEKVTLKTGQDLLSIYCIDSNMSRDNLRKFIEKEGFGDFLKSREENFIIDLMKDGHFDYESLLMVINKFSFLQEKESKEIILDALIRFSAGTGKFNGNCFYDNHGVHSMLDKKELPHKFIFGNLAQQKECYFKDEHIYALYHDADYLSGDLKKIIEKELYFYNSKQDDAEERIKYADFIFECNKTYNMMLKYQYKTVHSSLNEFGSFLSNVDINSDELKQVKILEKISEKDKNYKSMIISILEKKKIMEMMKAPELEPVNSVLKKRL